MNSLNLWQNAKKNPKTAILAVILAAIVIYSFVDDIHNVRHAATSYDYCKAICELFESSFKVITWCIYFFVCYLTYIHKQYSRWSIWLFYIVAAIMVIYYIGALRMSYYVFNHIGPDYFDSLPSMVHGLYGAPIYLIIFSFLFLPKLIKDVIKLKKEQDLTI